MRPPATGDEADIAEGDRFLDSVRRERLEVDCEQILAEVRRSTGLRHQPRIAANEPIERARKAVSARVRDAIKRIDEVAAALAAHLDRSVRTGIRCCYDPPTGEPTPTWTIRRE